MKKYLASYYGFSPYTGKHEVSIYKDMYNGSYSVYCDDEYWATFDALKDFEDEVVFIEIAYKVKINFFGF